ncbi:MAG TPA: helix-turn-helix domain-containing protein [Caulobacteraceae bacterium]|jgi:AcrR family transcriptional regulator|nr:helix-turn-helix domain-containing protein [Caulobacteraceae bacterium]
MSTKPRDPPQTWARKRSVTRARVLAAAAEVIQEKGFHRTSLDQIAAHAGLTKGAVYSSFASKEELFLAVLEGRPHQLEPKLKARMTRAEYFHALGEAAAALLPQARAQGAFFAEFFLYALTHEDMRQRMAERYATRFQEVGTAPTLNGAERLALPPREMSSLVQALSMGLMFQHMLTPDEITPELVVKAFQLLAGAPDGE